MRKILIYLLIIFAILLLMRFVLGGAEDDWICRDAEWIKHGNPSSDKPVGECE